MNRLSSLFDSCPELNILHSEFERSGSIKKSVERYWHIKNKFTIVVGKIFYLCLTKMFNAMKNAVKFKQIIQSLIADNTDPGKIEKAKQELSILIQTNFSQSFNKACSDEGMLFRIRLIEQDDCEKWRKVLPIFHNERATFNLDQIERILKRSLEKIYDDLIQVELKNDFGLHGNSFNSKWFGSFISDIVKNHLNDSLSALFHDRIASFNEAVKKEFSIN